MRRLNRPALLRELERPDLPADDRKLLEDSLRAYDEILEANPLEAFAPHRKQAVFLASTDRIKAFLGGNRSGKTTAGILDDLIQAVDADIVPEHLKSFKKFSPPFSCRVVSPDFTETMEGVIFEKLRQWVPRAQLVGGSWEKAYDKTRRKLNFANGSQFSFMTFEQDLDKFGGRSLDRVHYDEEPPEAIRKECRARLDRAGTDELFTMTPLQGMTWMYDGVYERRYEAGVTVVEVATDENPYVDRASMAEFFASLTPEEREARRKGRFVHFGGLVLGMWRDELHLVDEVRPERLHGQDIFVGIDPGWARGGVVWVALDRDDCMLVFDELYPSKENVDQIARQIHERNAYWGLDGDDVLYVIDPSGRNHSQAGDEGPEDEYARHGIRCVYGQNSRRTGIMQLRRRLGASPPLLKVARNCRWVLWERGRWRVAEDEESVQDKKAKGDRGQDSFKTIGPDHLWDPTRYVAMCRTVGPLFSEPRERPRRMDESWPPPTRGEPVAPTGALT